MSTYVYSKNPDQPITQKMVSIARHLKGKVQEKKAKCVLVAVVAAKLKPYDL